MAKYLLLHFMQVESIFIPFEGGELHLKRIFSNPDGPPAFLLHGSMENGKIFYSKSLKGYAPFLADQGYDVYVVDMQGRGESRPKMSRKSTYGQVDVIKTDIPLCLAKIKEIKGDVPVFAAAHSWGGVLLLAYMARFDHNIKNAVLFGVKRYITVRNWEYFKKLRLGWYFLGKLLIPIYGFYPATKLGAGSDEEPSQHYKQINAWLKVGSKWIDNVDGFDYGKALEEKQLPPLLFIAGKNDRLLGRPKDVQLLMEEVKHAKKDYWFLAKESGFMHDYGHIDMLTHKDAPKDFFGKIATWLKAN
ncbi:MAG: alpha/beta fold hydrolase [Chitinophagales bacterium]|nr:alpha/beta fold hydrolase [Chitinophagales bacterium]